jgi:hypothetical protein
VSDALVAADAMDLVAADEGLLHGACGGLDIKDKTIPCIGEAHG